MIEVSGWFFQWGVEPMSHFIQRMTNGPNHVGTILSDGLTVEASFSKGVYRREIPPETYDSKTGYRVIHLPVPKQYTHPERVMWADKLLEHVGMKAQYDWLGVAWVGLTILFPILRRVRVDIPSAYFCSECANDACHIVKSHTPTPAEFMRAIEAKLREEGYYDG